jgi:dipeptidyl aminopeptidase/acylaminoacyl peptidase
MMTNTMRRFLLAASLAFSCSLFAALPPVIPREVLFGGATRSAPQLSPDGTRIGWVAADANGVHNVFVQTIGGNDSHPVTFERHRDIYGFWWAADGTHLLYMQDGDGDENDHVFLADLEGKNVRDLTPFRGVKATNVLTSPRNPTQILVGLNLRDRGVFDMYRVDLDTGALTLEAKNPGDILSWSTDAQFVIRGATTFDRTSGRTAVRVRDSATAPWRELISWPFEESPIYFGQAFDGTMIVNFAPDGKTIDVLSSSGSNTLRVVTLDLKTGRQLAVLASDPKSDVSDYGAMTQPMMLVSETTGKLQAVAFDYITPEWKFIDESLRDDFARMAREVPGFLIPISAAAKGTKWIVSAHRSDSPPVYYVYDRTKKTVAKLFAERPELEPYTLAPKKGVVIRSRDGFDLVSYLTVPPGVEPKNLPLILLPHGGPFVRDFDDYDPMVQLLANRGYAVLQINYRGSEGFGRKFTNAFTRQWGLASQDDLIDGLRWAIAQGIADPKRVAALGGSGGGYATLRALTRDPDLFVCGVSLAGPSEVKTLIEAFPPYWGPSRERFIRRVGDVIHDDAFNREISPYYHIDQLRAPLLIEQGVHDPRVPIALSDNLVRTLRDAKREVTYVVYTDEGHGLGREENQIDFWGRAEEFLAKYLGGRAEPWKAVAGASAEVR